MGSIDQTVARALVVGGATLCAIACALPGTFACVDDAACAGTGAPGRCEPTGACSFPDLACPSRRRYGRHSAAGLANECVPPADESDETTTASGDGDSTAVDTTTGSVATDETAGEPGTTSSGASESSGVLESRGTSEETGSDTSGESLDCTFDDFDDGIDMVWCAFESEGVVLTESGGVLTCAMTPGDAGAYAGLATCGQADLSGVVASVELVQAPAPQPTVNTFIELTNDGDDGIGIGWRNDAIEAYFFVDHEYTTVAAVPYDPLAHRRLRLRDDDGTVHCETSDGVAWTELAAIPDDLDVLLAGRVWLSCGYNTPVVGPTQAIWNDYEICRPE